MNLELSTEILLQIAALVMQRNEKDITRDTKETSISPTSQHQNYRKSYASLANPNVFIGPPDRTESVFLLLKIGVHPPPISPPTCKHCTIPELLLSVLVSFINPVDTVTSSSHAN